MRLVLLALCVILEFANPAQVWGFQSSANSAEAQVAACAYPDQHADCEMYIRGFTDTVNEAVDLCGDTDAADLIAEFAQAARTNPYADKDKLLFNMLMENHKCSKTEGQIHNSVSAGALIDMCDAGDIGFDLCSEYRAGFSNALFLFSKLTETQSKIRILCGDKILLLTQQFGSTINCKPISGFVNKRPSNSCSMS